MNIMHNDFSAFVKAFALINNECLQIRVSQAKIHLIYHLGNRVKPFSVRMWT